MAHIPSSKQVMAQQASLFVITPTVFALLGLFYFQYPLQQWVVTMLPIPLFLGLGLLAMGSFIKESPLAKKFRISGWISFSAYWATQPNTLYFAEQQDIFNAALCIIGIYVLFYLAYHDWLSMKRNKTINSLRWIAGASAIAGLIYFIVDLTPLAELLINSVAIQSGVLLDIFTDGVRIDAPLIFYQQANIRIIFACTAVQSMVLFVGMILPLPNIDRKRKLYGLLITLVPVYFLNLIRNAGIIYLVGIYGDSFFSIAHNYIGKGGSLLALIILLFIVAKIVPELFDEILALIDLPKENGPIEQFIHHHLWRKKK
ncbi:MAG: archaeosortase A [Thermoplasmatota archaeon]